MRILQNMKRASLEGVELEYAVEGSGEPVFLVHGGVLADYLSLVRGEPTLTKQYRMISFSRRGFGGSTHHTGAFSIPEQASDCRKLMHHLSIERAHIVGHSYGGGIAMQLAVDSPERIRSLSLMEPLMPAAVLSASSMGKQFFQALAPISQMYQQGDRAGAVDAFMRVVAGPDFRTMLDRAMPGAFDQAVADADTFFKIELPASQEWNLTMEEAHRIRQPVLFLGGAESVFAPFVKELGEVMNKWFPQAEWITLPGVTHAFPIENPKGTAQALAGFFARHPLQVVA